MKLVFTPEAEEQADECDRWWREHRDAKDLFARELAATRTLLREAPNIGSMYTVLDGAARPARAAAEDENARLLLGGRGRRAGDGPRGVGGAEGARAEAVVVVGGAT